MTKGSGMLKKIGFIDYYLDEWHANQYPAWIRENAKEHQRKMDLAYAWAEIDLEDGLTTKEWCDQHKVQQIKSLEELVDRSDYLIVLSPDHPEHHERLSEVALQSGKPVYMDKTFSPDLATGERMFALANEHKTPMFSSSALRYGKELSTYKQMSDRMEYMATSGPGTYKNYAVHQFEMIVSIMGIGARRLKSFSTDHANVLLVEYEDGRQASFSQMSHAGFQADLQFKDGNGVSIPQCPEMFPRLIHEILTFFETGNPPVSPEETLEVMALIAAGRKAINSRDVWIDVNG